MVKRRDWILVVESEGDEGSLLKPAILKMGFHVLSCADCSRAQWYMQNQRFACVLIDHKVKGTSALSVISHVKKNPNHLNHRTPVILMSEGLEAGILSQFAGRIDGTLIKPFKEEQFVEKLKSVTTK